MSTRNRWCYHPPFPVPWDNSRSIAGAVLQDPFRGKSRNPPLVSSREFRVRAKPCRYSPPDHLAARPMARLPRVVYPIAMNKFQRSIAITFFTLITPLLLVGIPRHAGAGTTDDSIPENATASHSGSGWRCNAGFREADGACAGIVVPDNAFATNSKVGS